MKRRASFIPDWSIFAKGEDRVAVPRAPLLIRLRMMIDEGYIRQTALMPLKRFMDAVFIAGPVCILGATYLPEGSGLAMAWFGVGCLAVASLYWFAPHFMCRLYLGRRGYTLTGIVTAADPATALAETERAP